MITQTQTTATTRKANGSIREVSSEAYNNAGRWVNGREAQNGTSPYKYKFRK